MPLTCLGATNRAIENAAVSSLTLDSILSPAGAPFCMHLHGMVRWLLCCPNPKHPIHSDEDIPKAEAVRVNLACAVFIPDYS